MFFILKIYKTPQGELVQKLNQARERSSELEIQNATVIAELKTAKQEVSQSQKHILELCRSLEGKKENELQEPTSKLGQIVVSQSLDRQLEHHPDMESSSTTKKPAEATTSAFSSSSSTITTTVTPTPTSANARGGKEEDGIADENVAELSCSTPLESQGRLNALQLKYQAEWKQDDVEQELASLKAGYNQQSIAVAEVSEMLSLSFYIICVCVCEINILFLSYLATSRQRRRRRRKLPRSIA